MVLLLTFLKVPLEIPLVITEDMHSPPKIVIMIAQVTVPRIIKAHGGIRVATIPT